jgi:hypothetical protein
MLLRVVIALLGAAVGGSLRLTVALRIAGGLLARNDVWIGLVGLRPLSRALACSGIALARGTALRRPSIVWGTLGARHIENPSKR